MLMIKRLSHSMQLGGDNIIKSNGKVLYVGTKKEWETALKKFKNIFKDEGNYKSQRQIDAASRCKEHVYYFVISKDGIIMSITKSPRDCCGYTSTGPTVLSNVLNLTNDQLAILSKVAKPESKPEPKLSRKEKKEKKIIERNSKVDNKEEEVIVNTIQVEASLTSELVPYKDIINQSSLDNGYAFVVTDASCQPFMFNTSGAGLILTKEYYREIGYSKANVAEHSDIAELNSLVEALVLLKSLVEFNTIEKPSKVVCFVDNVSVIRNLGTPYTQIQEPMCRRLVRVGRICINSLAKVAKDGVVIEEIHPKIDYDSRVETLLHNKCDAVCKQHRMNDGIVREVILCHSK